MQKQGAKPQSRARKAPLGKARTPAKSCAMQALAKTLANAVDLDALILEVAPIISQSMRARRTLVFLCGKKGGGLTTKLSEKHGKTTLPAHDKKGIAHAVAKLRRSMLIPDTAREARFDPALDGDEERCARSIVAAPIIDNEGRLLGVLEVLDKRAENFKDSDVALLEAIAAKLARAMEHASFAARMLEQNRELTLARERAERRRAELELLYELEQETAAATDLDSLVSSALTRICERLRSEAGSVLLINTTNEKRYFRGVGADGSRATSFTVTSRTLDGDACNIVAWVAQHGQPALVNQPEIDERCENGGLDLPARAALAVPLVWNQRVMGAIEVQNPHAPRSGYDEEDLMLLTVVAGQLARAINLEIEREARQSTERLAAIGRMLAGVAHDLRNPMTVIAGYAQLLARTKSESDRVRSSQCIVREINEMTGMINDLLAFARGDSELRPSVISLRGLGDDVRENLHLHAVVRNVTLSVEPDDGSVLVDQGRIKRILYNLARNAIEAVAEQGHVTVTLKLEDGELLISVSDDGPGLPEELSASLFEPFTSSGKSHGTGLGLSIVKRFVDDHGGSIAVDSKAQRGTTITVRLPPVCLPG